MAERTEVVFTPFSPFEKGQKLASADFLQAPNTSVKTLLESIAERASSARKEGKEELGEEDCSLSSGGSRV